MRVQTFGAKLAVERFDKAVVGRLAGPREVENHTALIGPQIEIARDELRALVNTDALGIPEDPADPLQSLHDILSSKTEPCVDRRREPRECIDDRQHAEFARPVAS